MQSSYIFNAFEIPREREREREREKSKILQLRTYAPKVVFSKLPSIAQYMITDCNRIIFPNKTVTFCNLMFIIHPATFYEQQYEFVMNSMNLYGSKLFS